MWSVAYNTTQRDFVRHHSDWNHCKFTFLGIFSGSERTEKHYCAISDRFIPSESPFKRCNKFRNARRVQIFLWIFVSMQKKKKHCRIFNGIFMYTMFQFIHIHSIAGSSATIFAYLSEFHSSRNRSKVLMAASFIYGVSCNYMPALGYLVLNRTFHFHIPLFDIEYKPWRLYLLLCGLPSLVCAILLLLFIPESPKFIFSKVNRWFSIFHAILSAFSCGY